MKLLLDMHISPQVAASLRTLGLDAFHLRERNLQHLKDEQIVDLARSEERVIVTFDLDFTDLLASTGAESPSIIQFRLHSTRAADVERSLLAVLQQHETDLNSGCILTIARRRVRVRKLPISPDRAAGIRP